MGPPGGFGHKKSLIKMAADTLAEAATPKQSEPPRALTRPPDRPSPVRRTEGNEHEHVHNISKTNQGT